MSNITDYFTQAELALAAYADLQPGIPNIDRLQMDGDGMSLTQSEDFAKRWRVLDQHDGRVEETYTDEFGQEHTYLNPTGLSVTAFENVSTGEQVVAIRGTTITDINDIVTDVIDLIALGTSENQAQYAALSAKVQDWLDNGTLQSGFNVTGHSLGGFLATNLTFDYPTDIAHTYIYNAPGLTGVLGDLRQAIALALSPVVEIPTTFPDVLPVSNIVATGDVASSLGLYITPPIVMSVETRSPLGAHSMVRVTDALAIYNLFSAIDPNADLSNLTPILDAASNRGNESLESIIHSLSDLLINPIDVPIDQREPLYVAIQAIETELFVDRTIANSQLKPVYQNLEVESLANLTQEQIVAHANNDIAYRYALAHLNPFAITGRESLYDDHNQNDELELYDPVTQTGELTTAYLQDRTHYLRASLQRNEWDVQHLTAASGDGEL
ncbi:MAG: lipase family protein, partial [Candidatus Thiodiazotropha sp. (ex Troendleina suluensis)]|nr:lipase family protein [Candidatus Thiodiazotropha sp. (ex Troendleina suluensis)]